MTKILIFLIAGVIFILLLSYLVRFWINQIRKWRFEDEEFNKKKLKEALQELHETNELVSGMDFVSSKDMTVNYRRDKQLQELEKKV